eukprot:c22489_g1_i1 orf=435-881(+)
MGDCRRIRSGHHAEGCEVVCPKPQRVALRTCGTTEPFKSVCHRRSLLPVGGDYEAGHEIMDILVRKSADGEASNICCSPPYFCGSPPRRVGNPLVRDAHFAHPRVLPSSSSVQPKPLQVSSFKSSPTIRIEGFNCSRQDTRCGVLTLA